MSKDQIETIVWKLFRYLEAAESIQNASQNNPLVHDLAIVSEVLKDDMYWTNRGRKEVEMSDVIETFAFVVKEKFPAFAEVLKKEKPG